MPTYLGAGPIPDPVLQDLEEALDYVMNWTDLLAGDADSIQTSAWTVPSGVNVGDGVTVMSTPAGDVTPPAPTVFDSNQRCRAWIQVTTRGVKRIENTIRTNAGRVHSRTFLIDGADR